MCAEREESFGAYMIRHFIIYAITIIAVFAFVWTALIVMWLNIDAELIQDSITTIAYGGM